MRRHPLIRLALLLSLAAIAGMFLISVLGAAGTPTSLTTAPPAGSGATRLVVPPEARVAYTTPRRPTAIWVAWDGKGWRALSNVSAHPRACPVFWVPAKQRFIEPCIGSEYDRTGLNVAGPAPRPLDRYPVAVGRDGFLTVNLARLEKSR